ncbi:MAG: hypothetical protein Q4P20_08145 [Eubacteriales bacterium]|nr:hypothetical protein [Eubacteriales bacterium]
MNTTDIQRRIAELETLMDDLAIKLEENPNDDKLIAQYNICVDECNRLMES